MSTKGDEKLTYLLKFVKLIAGDEGYKVFKELMKYEDISENQLEEILGMKINDIRKALYKLEEYGLVKNYKIRNEDSAQYTYYWYIDRDMLNRNLLKLKKAVLEKLKTRYENEDDVYFYCPRCGMRFSYEDATSYDFTCPRCNEPLEMEENNLAKKILEKYIKKIEEEIKNEEANLH